MDCSEKFQKYYTFPAQSEVFCPYRVCPLGAHTDHNLGLVTGFAINEGITVTYSIDKSGKIRAKSEQFSGEKSWSISNVSAEKSGDWADYLRGATISVKRRFEIENGVNIYISGSMPVGGLSSSAAVTLSFIKVLCQANNIFPDEREYIEIALDAERNYVGVGCGKLDQSCEILCRKNKLLYLDTLTDDVRLIKPAESMPEFDIAVFFSGIEHSLVSSGYNTRVDELRSAARTVRAYSGAPYEKFGQANMRDVDRETFEKYAHLLPDNIRMRAEHWYNECERVIAGIKAFESGDIARFGSLMTKSGLSSINLWQTGSEELKTLTEILSQTNGVYGARFSGAGFSGCCIALTDPEKREDISAFVPDKYASAFPHLKNKFSVKFCKSADAMKI